MPPPNGTQNPAVSSPTAQNAQPVQAPTGSVRPWWREHLPLILIGGGLVAMFTLGPIGIIWLLFFGVTAVQQLTKEAKFKNERHPLAISVFKVFGAIGLAIVIAVGIVIAFLLFLIGGMATSGESS